jgi:phage terminase large subunit-like protein
LTSFNASSLALLPPEELATVLKSLNTAQIQALLHSWKFLARPEQLPPNPDTWQFWLFCAGRGAGKTRSGAEWVRDKVRLGAKLIALIAPTTADSRDVMVEGPSGIMSVCWEDDKDKYGNLMGVPLYEPSKRRITWHNGAQATTFSAEEPDRLRGPQHDTIWADELAAWRLPKDIDAGQNAWDMAMFGLRIGDNPQAMITTTPRPIPVIRELLRMSKGPSPMCVLTRASTYENRANLAGSFLSHIIAKYEGTRLGRQELEGELLEEVEGALWSRAIVDQAKDGRTPPEYRRKVVSVDPSVSVNPMSNLCGIMVMGLGTDNRGYVIDDLSGRLSPDEWAQKVVQAYYKHQCDRVVAEGNQGGDLVRINIHRVDPNVPVAIVHASRSKQARAEPVTGLYEQKRITHCQSFTELEDQMCTWVPLSGDPSPDRLDALVWGFTNLMLGVREPCLVIPFVSGKSRYIPGSERAVY